MKVEGFVQLWLNGELLEEGKNLIPTVGYNLLANIMAGTTPPSHIALGDSGALSTAGMTDLYGTELLRAAITSSVVSGSTITYYAPFSTSGSSLSIKELGVFNDASSGTMLARFSSAGLTLAAGDTLIASWGVKFGDLS